MEENLDTFNGSLDKTFGLPSRDWKQYAPLTLAYVGDAAYDLVIRTILVKREDVQTRKLHRKATSYVSAKAQAAIVKTLLPEFSGEEEAIYRRGRNASPATKPKSATTEEYLEATGFEALLGYLYLSGEFDRMCELIREGLANYDAE